MAAHSRWCLHYREGSPLYVTHFLYRIPSLYCISSAFFFLFGTNSCWQSSQLICMSFTQMTETNCAGNEMLLGLFIWLQPLMAVLMLGLLLLLLCNTALIPTSDTDPDLWTHCTSIVCTVPPLFYTVQLWPFYCCLYFKWLFYIYDSWPLWLSSQLWWSILVLPLDLLLLLLVYYHYSFNESCWQLDYSSYCSSY